MGWQDTDIEEGDGKYLRIKGGESVTFHILNQEPVKKMIHWINKKKVVCGGKVCVHCQEGNPVKQRWFTNVLDRKDGMVKIFEFGPGIAKDIKANAEDLATEGKTVHEVDFKIKAEGAGLETEYTVMQKLMGDPIPDTIELLPLT